MLTGTPSALLIGALMSGFILSSRIKVGRGSLFTIQLVTALLFGENGAVIGFFMVLVTGMVAGLWEALAPLEGNR